MVEALVTGLRSYLDSPFAFFGHSMGALLSFELTRALRRFGLRLPDALIVSAHRAPQLGRERAPIHALPEVQSRQELRTLNGTPEAVLEHPELMGLFGPILRADFELCETYAYVPESPLSVPILALAGKQDPQVSPENVGLWKEQTTGRFEQRIFEGDHFYLTPRKDEVVASIQGFLKARG
jgi:medium-chain acyl-[acyl-carrier-protein] hydrolase